MRIPLRLRLTVAFACGMALVLVSLGAFLYLRLGRELLRSVDMGLRSRAQVIVAGIGKRHVGFTGQSGTLIDPDEAFAQILDPRGPSAIVESSAAFADVPLVPPSLLSSVHGATFLDRPVRGIDAQARLLVVPAEGDAHRLYVVVGATLSDRLEALDRLLALFAIGGPVALILTSGAGWLLAGAALRPVERLRAEAAAISGSEPDRRLAVPATGDELERLATTLNAMLDRLEEALGRERRFVDDASHELRTPLSVLKAELDLTLARARTPDELERALRRASGETDRLARLAEDLLVLSRAEGGRLPVHRIAVSLSAVVRQACRGQQHRADEAGVRLSVDVADGQVRLDPVRLRQAIENLVDNALRYAGGGGEVRVAARHEGDVVHLSVADSGPGFPEGFLDRAFEPFARGDGSSGAGLGLAIVRTVAEAHGGSARAGNRPEGGALVELVLHT